MSSTLSALVQVTIQFFAHEAVGFVPKMLFSQAKAPLNLHEQDLEFPHKLSLVRMKV